MQSETAEARQQKSEPTTTQRTTKREEKSTNAAFACVPMAAPWSVIIFDDRNHKTTWFAQRTTYGPWIFSHSRRIQNGVRFVFFVRIIAGGKGTSFVPKKSTRPKMTASDD